MRGLDVARGPISERPVYTVRQLAGDHVGKRRASRCRARRTDASPLLGGVFLGDGDSDTVAIRMHLGLGSIQA